MQITNHKPRNAPTCSRALLSLSTIQANAPVETTTSSPRTCHVVWYPLPLPLSAAVAAAASFYLCLCLSRCLHRLHTHTPRRHLHIAASRTTHGRGVPL